MQTVLLVLFVIVSSVATFVFFFRHALKRGFVAPTVCPDCRLDDFDCLCDFPEIPPFIEPLDNETNINRSTN